MIFDCSNFGFGTGRPTLDTFEADKRRRNLKDGYKEEKGLKDGYCNRRACQKPLKNESAIIGERYSMEDHETSTSNRLYYCAECAMAFTSSDMMVKSNLPPRIRIDKIEAEK